MEYETLDNHPRARSDDPITSHMAADDAKELAKRHANAILLCLTNAGPLGKDGIAKHTGINGVAVARRLPELERNGFARPTGKHVTSNTGRQEREWASTAWLSKA